MKTHNNIIKNFAWALVLMLFVGCNKTEIEGDSMSMGESVECQLNLISGAMDNGTSNSSTRSIDDGTDINEFTIENLWVIQFDSKGTVVGFPKYIADYTDQSSVTLLNPGTDTHKVLYLANTYNPNFSIQVKMSMSDVLSLSKLVEKISHCVNYEKVGDTKEIRVMTSAMTEITSASLSGGTLPACTLKSGVAKITLNISKASNLNDLNIKSIQLKNVCNKLYYYYSDDNRNSNDFPLTSDFEAIDYPYIEENKSSYTFYVPMNCRGKRENEGENPMLKPHYAQTKDTYANVHADINGAPRDYKFYLGADLFEDFNLKANHKYVYNIEFNSKGDYNTDSRIEGYGDFDYTIFPSSNCYILNPSPLHSREYLIPAAERVNDFWTNYDLKPENQIYDDTEWECELIWSDAESTIGTDDTEISFTQDETNPKAMKITVPAGLNHGNYVVGIKKQSSTDYLWSWHFWVTDYRPSDVARTLMVYPELNTEYRYGVTGGEVHKYSSAGETANGEICYIMDRTIGARSIDAANDFKGLLMYQFGRKDPFPESTVTLNPKGKFTNPYSVEISNTMEYSVYHPNTFLTNNAASDVNTGDWEGSKADYKDTNIIWNDRNVARGSGGKSIFDPSPHGWRIPEINAYARASNTYGSLLYSPQGSNVTYYYNNKNIGKVSLSNYLAKFPAYGTIEGSTGKFKTSSYVYYWLCYPSQNLNYVGYGTYALLSGTTGFGTNNATKTRAEAQSLRPIYYQADFTPISQNE